MGISTVNSPNNSSRNNPRWGASPGSRSSPSNHLDSHLVRSPGKGPSVRRDGAVPAATPVVGGKAAAQLERSLDRGLRNDRR